MDWIDNIRQGLGYESDQYETAMQVAFGLKSTPAFNQGNLIAAGHSLGGGLASAASVAAAIPAHTFNAAGLHSNSLNEALYNGSIARYNNEVTPNNGVPKLVKAYYVDWDILSLLQKHFIAVIGVPPNLTVIDPPEAVGQRIEKDGPYDTELLLSAVVTLVSAPVGVGSAGYFTVLSHMNDAVLSSLLEEYGVFGYDL